MQNTFHEAKGQAMEAADVELVQVQQRALESTVQQAAHVTGRGVGELTTPQVRAYTSGFEVMLHAGGAVRLLLPCCDLEVADMP